MKQIMGVLLLVLMSGTQLCPQASKQAEDHWEQTNFGAEGDSERPVAIPGAALQQLRTSKNRDDLIQMCAEDEQISIERIPPVVVRCIGD
jgi:hypothetical protein